MQVIKGRYAKRKGGLLLGRIFFEQRRILLKYLFCKTKIYSDSDIKRITYTYFPFNRAGYVKYFEITFFDGKKIYVYEKRDTRNVDLCRSYLRKRYAGQFINKEIDRLKETD